MNKIKFLLVVMLAVVLYGCSSDDDNTSETPKAEVVTLNVDVVLPASIRSQWQNSIDWAVSNIDKAQRLQNRQVKLNLRYHDEDTEDVDKLGYSLTHPEAGGDTCHAIIGPYHSSNATNLLRYAKQNRLPVLMPTCTSSELQRTYSNSTFAWFMTESDITQCEIMLSAAHAMQASDVALIYSDDLYGESFKDWFGYYATEQSLHVTGSGMRAYNKGQNLTTFLDDVTDNVQGDEVMILLALSDVADYKPVLDQCQAYWVNALDHGKNVYIRTICADTSFDEDLIKIPNLDSFDLGISPCASMNYGYPQCYEGRYQHGPVNGEAQIYDALCLIALGAAHQLASPDKCLVDGKQVAYTQKPYEATLTDYMRSVVSSESGASTQWDADGLAIAFRELSAGRSVNLSGATGSLFTDRSTHTKVLNTSYMLWSLNQLEAGNKIAAMVTPLLFLSTAGTGSEASTTEFWKLDKMWQQFISDEAVDHQLPVVSDYWAVVFSPSTTWSNYRHQADALAMYQLLRKHGYDDDHIILIVEDNLANDAHNVFPGQIFVERSEGEGGSGALVNEDLRKDAVVDYHFSDLQGPEDLVDIMMGKTSDRLTQVIHPTASSNVFFFWSGHGGNREGPLWGNEDTSKYFGSQLISSTIAQMKQNGQYRRMMLAIETCFSGRWGEAITGTPDVLVITAATPNETSKADLYDDDLGVYLSNAFARTFRNVLNRSADIPVYNLYSVLYRATTGSHVSIYNQQQYGSVYTETMSDFFPE